MNEHAQIVIADVDREIAELTKSRNDLATHYGLNVPQFHVERPFTAELNSKKQKRAPSPGKRKPGRAGFGSADERDEAGPKMGGGKRKMRAKGNSPRSEALARAEAAAAQVMAIDGEFTSDIALKAIEDAGIKGMDEGTRLIGLLQRMVTAGELKVVGRNGKRAVFAAVRDPSETSSAPSASLRENVSAPRMTSAEYEARKESLGIAAKPKPTED